MERSSSHIDNPDNYSLILTLKPILALTHLAALTNPRDYSFGINLYRQWPEIILTPLSSLFAGAFITVSSSQNWTPSKFIWTPCRLILRLTPLKHLTFWSTIAALLLQQLPHPWTTLVHLLVRATALTPFH